MISMFSAKAAELETCKGFQLFLLAAEDVVGANASEDFVQKRSAVAATNISRVMIFDGRKNGEDD